MKSWNDLDLEATQQIWIQVLYWESSVLTTRIIEKAIPILNIIVQLLQTFCSGCFRQFFFNWSTKKVVAGRVKQVVVLYSNNCMGIGLGGLSTGHWLSYKGGRISRFDCNSKFCFIPLVRGCREFKRMNYFYRPWNDQKIYEFLIILGGIEHNSLKFASYYKRNLPKIPFLSSEKKIKNTHFVISRYFWRYVSFKRKIFYDIGSY